MYTQSLHMVMMGTAAFFASAVRGVQLAVCLSLPLEEYAQAEVSGSLRACMCMCAHSVVMSAGSAAFVVNHERTNYDPSFSGRVSSRVFVVCWDGF